MEGRIQWLKISEEVITPLDGCFEVKLSQDGRELTGDGGRCSDNTPLDCEQTIKKGGKERFPELVARCYFPGGEKALC